MMTVTVPESHYLKNRLLILALICIPQLLFSRDSVRVQWKLSAIAGTCGFYLSQDLNAIYPYRKSFGIYEINSSDYYCAGLKTNTNITNRKEFSSSLVYSNAYLGYRYSDYTPGKSADYSGRIQFNGIWLQTIVQYRVFKWFKINYGLNHYCNIVNDFDSMSLAQKINWYDSKGNSNIRPYTVSLSWGAEFLIYSRLSAEINVMRGLNNFAVLQFKDDRSSLSDMRLRYACLSLNYRLTGQRGKK